MLALVLAGATTWGLDAGQLVLWATFWIYAGIAALLLRRTVPAGTVLGLATIKITTGFPFLLLLLNRRYWKAWLAFAAVLAGLCCCLYSPASSRAMVARQVANIQQARQTGEINDYTFSGPFHDDILGLEHWLFCLGLRDRGAISAWQLAILGVIGFGLLRLRVRARTDDDEFRLAVLLCVYSCLFLYHRMYDTVVLALPLFHCVRKAGQETGRRAAAYRWIATGIILVMNFPRGGVLIRLADWSQHSGLAGRAVQVVVLPYGTWVLLAALFGLWWLEAAGTGPNQPAGSSG